MKFTLRMSCLFLFALIFCSCGKKAQNGTSDTKTKKSSPSVSERLFDAQMALENAVKSNDTRNLRLVIFENPDLSLDRPLEDGDTLLTHAVKKRYPLIVSILLEKGASPDLKSLEADTPGQTPLMIASFMGQLPIIRILLEKGAYLNYQDDLGDTALHKAILNGYDDAARILIRAGADLLVENNKEQTPVEVATALNRSDIRDTLNGIMGLTQRLPSIEVFRDILENADLINFRKAVNLYPDIIHTYESLNPLVLVTEAQSELRGFELAQALIELKASINGPARAETTPLIRAVTLKKINFVELILGEKPDLEKTDKTDRPALYYAIMNNDLAMTDILIHNGALEKFETWKDGRKISFKGCKVADNNQRNLKTPEDQDTNRRIQSRLGCRWTR